MTDIQQKDLYQFILFPSTIATRPSKFVVKKLIVIIVTELKQV